MKHALHLLYFLAACFVIGLTGCATTDEEVGPEDVDYPDPNPLEIQREVQETHNRYIRQGNI